MVMHSCDQFRAGIGSNLELSLTEGKMERFLGPVAWLLQATGTSLSISWDVMNGAAPWIVAVSALGALPVIHGLAKTLFPMDPADANCIKA